MTDKPKDLKPCPICGNDLYCTTVISILGDDPEYFNAECTCGYEFNGTPGLEPDEFLEAANRRVEPTNEPLTVEEIKEMVGEPVWDNVFKEYVLITGEGECVFSYMAKRGTGHERATKTAIEIGKFYRRRPEGE